MRLPISLSSAARPARFRRMAAVGLVCLVALSPAGAQAQNFFEELFGIGKAAKPPAPPRNVPAEPSPAPGPTAPGAPALPGEGAETRPSAPAAPRQPVVLKVPAEDNVVGQDLLLNGLNGALKIEKAGAGYTASMTLPGTKVSQPTEACAVKLNAGKPVALTAEGRSQGVSRFSVSAPECPLKLEVLDGSVLATPLGDKVCTFTAQDCATTPGGLWGPGAAALIPQAGEFDTARGVADKAVRDNFKIMTQRARGQDVRPIVQEQAAFSSDREQACRTYAREGAHGYCHLRYTEARAIALAARLGANTASPTASNTPAPRPRRPKPAVDGVNPDAAGGGDPFFEP
jgi:hypothetical protein